MAEPSSSTSPFRRLSSSDADMSFAERAFSAAGAAVVSAIIVNPLDVAKGFLAPENKVFVWVTLNKVASTSRWSAIPSGYTMTQHLGALLIVFFICICILSLFPVYPNILKFARISVATLLIYMVGDMVQVVLPIVPGTGEHLTCSTSYEIKFLQEGYARLWRGTNASLVLAVPTVGIYLPCYDIFRNWMENITSLHKPELTPYVPLLAGSAARTLACLACSPIELARTRMQAFKSSQTGSKLPGMWTTLLGVLSPGRSNTYLEKMQGYRVLWMGAGAQLARDVPFSAICWSTLEPTRRRLLGMVEDGNAFHVLGANFLAGYVAGSLAAAATCPLDVAKTRRQIENDPEKMLMTTTRNTLLQVWRNEGAKGLFTGVGPRVARAGPSVGIVISFYEVVKYLLHRGHADS
ncbi:hypothetical protein ZIOFF_046635 [Zingiber officinale]|uniref:Mitochondrial carrier protein n=1 Tax=Zingiber officinale TaxID=94328 RepID=A0A8J5FPM1_ZINOF|nr:hypothetical protein ZIOFF_046635 [Zingiber officinale]